MLFLWYTVSSALSKLLKAWSVICKSSVPNGNNNNDIKAIHNCITLYWALGEGLPWQHRLAVEKIILFIGGTIFLSIPYTDLTQRSHQIVDCTTMGLWGATTCPTFERLMQSHQQLNCTVPLSVLSWILTLGCRRAMRTLHNTLCNSGVWPQATE